MLTLLGAADDAVDDICGADDNDVANDNRDTSVDDDALDRLAIATFVDIDGAVLVTRAPMCPPVAAAYTSAGDAVTDAFDVTGIDFTACRRPNAPLPSSTAPPPLGAVFASPTCAKFCRRPLRR